MNAEIDPSYVSGLRMKAGELTGLRDLAPDIADMVLPRLIIPPPKERDRQIQQDLFRLPEEPKVHGVLGRYWSNRPTLLQCTYLLREVAAAPDKWLPALFEEAREHEIDAIPAFSVAEVLSHSLAVRASVNPSAALGLSLIISFAETVQPDLPTRIAVALDRLRIDPSKCGILIDFADADLSDSEIVAPIISAAFEALRRIGPWRFLAFQGTAFPEHNPANHGATQRVERSEWLAWRRAIGPDAGPSATVLFGDYGADCAKFSFGKGGGRAYRHLRYTTEEYWYVVRAAEKGKDAVLMRDVCHRILASSWYDGRDYSLADDQIFRMAHGMKGPGVASDWRAINTGHHITRVVRELGAMKDVRFSTLRASDLEQPAAVIPNLIPQEQDS